MGTLALRDIGSWRVRPAFDADDGVPVGRRRCKPMKHTATLAEVGRDDRVVYGEEIPIGVFASEVRELPSEVVENLGIPRMHAWLFMATPPGEGEGRVHEIDLTKQFTVFFSALPYSQNRFFSAPLRRISHRSADEINHKLIEAVKTTKPGDPERRLQEALSDLTFAPFLNTRGRSAAAWMICPSHSDLLGAGRFDDERDYTVGVCRDWQVCVEQLRADPLIEKLVELTRDDRLFASLPDRDQHKKGPVARHVSADAKDHSELAMTLAIQLALAGVVDGDRLYGSGSAGAAGERFVALQVEPIYRDIIYEWSRDSTAPSAPPPGPPSGLPAGRPGPPPRDEADGGAVAPEPDVRERIENMREYLRMLGESDVMRKLTAEAASWNPEDETFLRLVLACPLEWRLTAALERVLRVALRHVDPASLEYALVRERLDARHPA